jgi:hypothetical protein
MIAWYIQDNIYLKWQNKNVLEEVIQRCRVELGPASTTSQPATTTQREQNEQQDRAQERNSKGSPAQNKLEGKNCSDKNVEVNKLKLHQCFLCDHQAFDKHQGVVQHMRQKHAGQYVQCKHNGQCARLFRTEEEKKKHVLKDHKPMVNCDFCHRTYSFDSIRGHMAVYHKDLFSCSYRFCSSYFRSVEELNKHEERIHAVRNKMTRCIFCGLFFKCMRGHLKSIHAPQLPHAFKCTSVHCAAYFLTAEERNEHEASAHRKIVRKEVKCIYCKQMCPDTNLLHAHVKYFHYEYKILCKFSRCSRYFHSQVRADAHFERMHRKKEDKKMFKCSKCDFKSARKDGIVTHEAHLHADKTIPCPKCEKMFGSIRIMNFHLKTHKEPEICEHCNEKSASLRSHQKQEKCKYCHEVLMCVKLARQHQKTCKL